MRLAARARGRVFVALPLEFGAFADDVECGLAAGARERGVSPLAGEVLRASDHDSGFNGGALARVAGDGVGVLQVLGYVSSRGGSSCGRRRLRTSPGPALDCGDGGDAAVVDVQAAVVAAGDDAVADCPVAGRRTRCLARAASPAARSRSRARALSASRVALSRTIITASSGPWAARSSSPAIDAAATRRAGGMKGDVLALVREVRLRIAVVEGGEGGSLGRISLAHDLQQLPCS